MYQKWQDAVIVATAGSAARAEFIQMTLAAHGYRAVVRARSIHPSIDFVEGVDVSVAAADADAVRKLLEALRIDPEAGEIAPEP